MRDVYNHAANRILDYDQQPRRHDQLQILLWMYNRIKRMPKH